jgi:hypothetical protein
MLCLHFHCGLKSFDFLFIALPQADSKHNFLAQSFFVLESRQGFFLLELGGSRGENFLEKGREKFLRSRKMLGKYINK